MNQEKGGGFPSIKVPGVGLLDGIFGFITKFLYGIVILKLIEFVPKLKGVLGAIKKSVRFLNLYLALLLLVLD